MKVTCIQMDVQLGQTNRNFENAADLIAKAMQDSPDVLVLPETWNTGFFPKENLPSLCDNDGETVKAHIGTLAKKFSVNIVAGSAANLRGGKVYNTAMIFDRSGTCIASYDKTHLFTPMGEDAFFTAGDKLCRFTLDGVSCGIAICYDLRFPELARKLTTDGIEMLFVVSQWPRERIFHLQSLITARAVENQMFVVCCNGCGTAGQTVYGGHSAIVNPLGETLAQAGDAEMLLTACCDTTILKEIRNTIPVLRDRRPDLY